MRVDEPVPSGHSARVGAASGKSPGRTLGAAAARSVCLILVSLVIAACSNDATTEPQDSVDATTTSTSGDSSASQSDQLALARSIWASRAGGDYTMTIDSWDMRGTLICTFKVSNGVSALVGSPKAGDGGWNGSMTVPSDACQTVPSTVEAALDAVGLALGPNSLPVDVTYDDNGVPISLAPGEGVADGGGFGIVLQPSA